MTQQELAELYVEELTAHQSHHGLELWLSRGFTFFRRACGPTRVARPLRGRVLPRAETQKRTSNNQLIGPLTQVRDVVKDMRSRGATPADVRRYVTTQTPFTLRSVFRACSDDFERACYADV